VAAGNELGLGVVAVVDDRLVNAAEARAGIGGDELEVQRLDHVDHEVAAGPVGGEDLNVAAGIDLARCDGCAGLSGWRPLRGLSRGGGRAGTECRRAGDGRGLQEITTIDRMLL
jgi:hypothetical protein